MASVLAFVLELSNTTLQWKLNSLCPVTITTLLSIKSISYLTNHGVGYARCMFNGAWTNIRDWPQLKYTPMTCPDCTVGHKSMSPKLTHMGKWPDYLICQTCFESGSLIGSEQALQALLRSQQKYCKLGLYTVTVFTVVRLPYIRRRMVSRRGFFGIKIQLLYSTHLYRLFGA